MIYLSQHCMIWLVVVLQGFRQRKSFPSLLTGDFCYSQCCSKQNYNFLTLVPSVDLNGYISAYAVAIKPVNTIIVLGHGPFLILLNSRYITSVIGSRRKIEPVKETQLTLVSHFLNVIDHSFFSSCTSLPHYLGLSYSQIYLLKIANIILGTSGWLGSILWMIKMIHLWESAQDFLWWQSDLLNE